VIATEVYEEVSGASRAVLIVRGHKLTISEAVKRLAMPEKKFVNGGGTTGAISEAGRDTETNRRSEAEVSTSSASNERYVLLFHASQEPLCGPCSYPHPSR